MSLVRAHADRARRDIAERVARRRGIFVASVTARAGAGLDLDSAIDVQSGSSDSPLGVDDRRMAHRALL
jgi:hypothetical protein